MPSEWEKFIAAYTSASDDVKRVIDSEVIGIFVEQLIEKYSYPAAIQRELLLHISDHILSICTFEELLERIVGSNQLAEDHRQELIRDLKTFLTAPFRTESVLTPLTRSAQQTSPELPPTAPDTSVTPPSIDRPQNAAVNDATAQLERLRTMQQDADRIHGYGAYRRKYQTPEATQRGASTRDPLANLPKYEDK